MGRPRKQRQVLEAHPRPVIGTPVQEDEVGRHVVGDVEVGPAVVGEVAEDHPEALAAGAAEARLGGGVFEGAVAAVQVEAVGLAVVDVGMAVRAHAAGDDAADLVVGEGEVHVVGHVEVEVAVAVGVAEGRRGAPQGIAHAGALGRLGEGTVT